MAIRVWVVVAPAARTVREVALELAPGSTVAQALQASGLRDVYPELAGDAGEVGIWGQKVPLGRVLQDQDRVEVYRPLTVDPKLARRTRFVQQGARTAGLFARRRPGGKAGY